jgi:hypothetical protein
MTTATLKSTGWESCPTTNKRHGILRQAPWDALLVALAFGHALVLWLAPVAPVFALGLWWNSNTIAHYFIHQPFFRARWLNRLFGLYQSVLLGIPQTLWRDRHLAHHAGVPWRLRASGQFLAEVVLIALLWGALAGFVPRFFLTVYLPGYLAGLSLCWLHGYYEHACGTVSHHGWLYNFFFLNDGYHAEHHAHPGMHWKRLPELVRPGTPVSRWPAVLRWLDAFSLEGLERWVVRWGPLQRFVLNRHERAWRRLLPQLQSVRRVAVVGGGLFPRTCLLCRKLLPGAELVVIDASARNIETARSFLPADARFIQAWYNPDEHDGFDLLVIPLAYIGDRDVFYRRPPAPAVLVHDWIWHRHRPGAIVSLLLCKRLNLVKA